MSGKTKHTRSSRARNRKARAVSFVGNIRTPLRARFGAALRSRREELGLTQEHVAMAAGVNRTYLFEVENGRESISIERAERLAQALDCKLSDLLGEE